MCLAIYKPAGAYVKEEHLRNGFSNHSDGAGFAWADGGVLHVKKGIFDVEEFITQYELIKEYPALIHFRKATHGKIDVTNCHPFVFSDRDDKKFALIHNGIISIKCTIEGLSDTAHFVKLVLEPMVKRNGVAINDGALHYLIETSIGTDKMVIMDGDGTTYVFNEDKGKWEGGCWYSNTSFSWSYKTSSSTSVYQNGHHYGGSRTGENSYIDRTNTNGVSAGTSNSSRNWRKQFEQDAEDDESYLEFWKRTKDVNTAVADYSEDNKKTQVIPTVRDGVDSAGNVHTDEYIDVEEAITDDIEHETPTYGPGQMCEYGWWDEEIENDIATMKLNTGINREQAIVRVFNN